jgi:hypothetical protein
MQVLEVFCLPWEVLPLEPHRVLGVLHQVLDVPQAAPQATLEEH